MKKHAVELYILLICLTGIGYHIYTHIDWNPPKKRTISNVQINGKIMPIAQVQAEQIPQAIYDGISSNGTYKEFITGDKKQVVLFTWDGCPYARAFSSALETMFQQKYVRNFYQKNIVHVPQSSTLSCNNGTNLHCPQVWLMQHCGNGLCIINPKTKEAIIDTSQNAKQILPLLAAYAKWDKEPLLEEPQP